jgi:hypothetical protein
MRLIDDSSECKFLDNRKQKYQLLSTSWFPEVLKPIRRQLGIPHRVLDVLASHFRGPTTVNLRSFFILDGAASVACPTDSA